MRINKVSIFLSILATGLLLAQSTFATPAMERKKTDFTQRYDTLFTVIEETFDASDYSETFRQSFLNFQTNYSANNCNYAERMQVLEKKYKLLDDLIDNINLYTKADVQAKMEAYKLYDFELTLLRNLDVLEAIPVNDPRYSREPLYTIMINEHAVDFNSDSRAVTAEVDRLLTIYEENFNKRTTEDGKVKITGKYSECTNRFNRTYQAWTETLEKFEKGNDQQVAALNKALKEFIKSIKEFKKNFQNNLNKVFKEEMAFLDKNTKDDDSFMQNMWNLTKGSAKAVGGDFVKVGKAFQKEYTQLKTNAGSSPEQLKKFLISNRTLDNSQSAFEDALRSGLNLNQIAQSVEALKEQAEASLTLEKKIKKIQMLTDVHAAYSLEIQAASGIPINYFQDCLKTIKGSEGIKSLDKIFEYVYTNQCK